MQHFVAKIWDTRKITLIDTTLECFGEALLRIAEGRDAPPPISIGEGRILPRFLRNVPVATDMEAEISNAFDFPELHDGEPPQPELFFRGAPARWADIRKGIDAARDIADDILHEVLIDPSEEVTPPSPRITKFALLTGPAGTGKSTLMMRLAWELSETYGEAVAWLRDASVAQFDLIEYMATQANRRIYVFVDNCADAGATIADLVRRCRNRSLRVSFLASDRANEWKASTRVRPMDPDILFELDRISRAEAEKVLDRLGHEKQLGVLRDLDREEQVNRLLERAGAHLLVALREVTEDGKRFDEIIVDEYENIPAQIARDAYVWICTLFQFGIPMRAGILSRAVGVPLGEFGDKILKPNHQVVLERQRGPTSQPLYQARHEVIADIVFNRAFPTAHARANQVLSALIQLDPGYRDDMRAFVRLINHNWLRKIGLGPLETRDIYALARRLRPDDASIVHQEAMSLRLVNRSEAQRLIREAERLAPKDDMIRHSSATLMLDDAWAADPPARSRLLEEAEADLRKLIAVDPANGAPYVSLARMYWKLAGFADDVAEKVRLLAEAEKVLGQAFLRCQLSEHLLRAMADIEETSGDLTQAEEAFRKATGQPGADAQTWISLARFLQRRGRINEAVQSLNSGLDLHPTDALLNFRLAMTLQEVHPISDRAVRRAFEYALAEPVRGFLPELEYAIYLFVAGDQAVASEHFRQLRGLVIPHWTKFRPHRWIRDSVGDRRRFSAAVIGMGISSSQVKIDGFDDLVFAHPNDLPRGTRVGSVVDVYVYFNVLGTRATGIDSIRLRTNGSFDDEQNSELGGGSL